MIEIQCTSCHTRYRIDERVLPEETPTFKCSRCGHVFNAEPTPARQKKAAPKTTEQPTSSSAETSEPPDAVEPETAAPDNKAEPGSFPVEPESAAAPEDPETEPRPGPESRAESFAEKQLEAPSAAQTPVTEESPKPEPPPAKDPFERTFIHQREENAERGANLSFTFTNEPRLDQDLSAPEEREHQPRSEEHWQVGEEEGHSIPEEPHDPLAGAELDVVRGRGRQGRHRPTPEFEGPVRPMRRRAIVKSRFPSGDFAQEAPHFADPSRQAQHQPEIPDEVAYFAEYRSVHSSGWFLSLFAIIALVFMGGWIMVHMEPEAVARMLSQAPTIGTRFQRPMVPAMLVALHDVHADYQQLKGGQNALLISGSAENVGSTPLHAVLLAVDLLDGGGKQLAGGAAYCGNGLTPKMVGEMTPREIGFLQRLDPQKNFVLDPSHTTPFLMVFIDPPHNLANLRIQVAKAVPAQSPRPHS